MKSFCLLPLVLPSVSAIVPTFSFCPIDAIPLIACDCSQTIFPPLITSTCTSETPVVCTPLVDVVCGTPSLTTTVDFLRIFSLEFPLTAEICYKEIEIFGTPSGLDDLCFEFVTPIVSFITGFFVSSDSVEAEGKQSPFSAYSKCYARANGEECEFCDVCLDGQGGVGVMFQCGEIQSSTCSTILTKSLPTSTKESVSVDSVVSLDIDGTA
jgi:hypothetical protein